MVHCNRNKFIFLFKTIYFIIGTSYVTSFQEFKRFPNLIQARWKKLDYPAKKLVITATCKYDCSNSQIYLSRKELLTSNETTYTFTGLAHGSLCDFTLKAVYNPATLDKGITVTYLVLPASK